MIALADDYEEVNEVTEGQIAASTGLKVFPLIVFCTST